MRRPESRSDNPWLSPHFLPHPNRRSIHIKEPHLLATLSAKTVDAHCDREFHRCLRQFAKALIVAKKSEKRRTNLYAAVIVDKSPAPEAVHEVAHPGPRGADHFCKRFLAHFEKDGLCLCVRLQFRPSATIRVPAFSRLN